MNPTEFKPTSLVERLMPHSKPLRALLFVFMDIVACVLASFMGLWLRFDFSVSHIPEEYWKHALWFLPIYIVVTVVCFYANKMYKYMSLQLKDREDEAGKKLFRQLNLRKLSRRYSAITAYTDSARMISWSLYATNPRTLPLSSARSTMRYLSSRSPRRSAARR